MDCSRIIELLEDRDSMSLIDRLQISLHIFFCESCAEKIEKMETVKNIMRTDFFHASPGLEDSIMNKIALEEEITEPAYNTNTAGFSLRSWVITGIIIFISLAAVFTGMEFRNIVSHSGISFTVPMGLITGLIMTTYGALFIGCNLKELSEKFGL